MTDLRPTKVKCHNINVLNLKLWSAWTGPQPQLPLADLPSLGSPAHSQGFIEYVLYKSLRVVRRSVILQSQSVILQRKLVLLQGTLVGHLKLVLFARPPKMYLKCFH